MYQCHLWNVELVLGFYHKLSDMTNAYLRCPPSFIPMQCAAGLQICTQWYFVQNDMTKYYAVCWALIPVPHNYQSAIHCHQTRRTRFRLGRLSNASNFYQQRGVRRQFGMLEILIYMLLSPSSSISLSTNPLEFCSKNVRNLWPIFPSAYCAWGLRCRTLWVGRILLMALVRQEAIALRDYHTVYNSNWVVECQA